MSHDDDDIVVIRIVADVLQFKLTYDKSAEIYGFDKNRRHRRRYDIITHGCCSIIHRFNIKRWPATDSAIRGFFYAALQCLAVTITGRGRRWWRVT